jgi:chromosome segregation ATPase
MGIILMWLRQILRAEDHTAARMDAALARLEHITRTLHRIEAHMSKQSEQIDAVSAQIDAIAADVQILVDRPTGDDPEVQAAIDRLSQKVGALQTEVGDQDGSDTPPADGGDSTTPAV